MFFVSKDILSIIPNLYNTCIVKNTDVIILAAGYATRLYPLTLTQPKPLLKVAGRPILEHILDNFHNIPHIKNIHIVSNKKFYSHFEQWLEDRPPTINAPTIILTNDGSVDETDKLGAIGDLDLVIREQGISDDVVVVAGDNLFKHPLHGFIEHGSKKQSPVLGIYDVGSLDDAKRFGCITVNEDGQITSFEEKPPEPKSSLIGIALYHYPKHTLPLIAQYVHEGNNPDQPGRLVEWLHTRVPFYTWQIPGMWHDIGSKETLDHVHKTLSQKE